MGHPNIMRLYEVIDSRTHVHLVMELCAGMPIQHHLKKLPNQRMNEEQCKVIFRQLMLAVGYMHSRGKSHRDLKLDNILYDSETQQIKIIDFGFSLGLGLDKKVDFWCGTLFYMDPDLVKKVPYSPFAADIWAVGVILYMIYVGKMPYFGEFEGDVNRKIQ